MLDLTHHARLKIIERSSLKLSYVYYLLLNKIFVEYKIGSRRRYRLIYDSDNLIYYILVCAGGSGVSALNGKNSTLRNKLFKITNKTS